ERVIAGVAGGVADYLNVDPAIVRVIWAVLVFTTGGLFGLIYIIMWIVVPEAPAGYESTAWAGTSSEPMPPGSEPRPVGPPPPVARRGSGDGRLILGAILIVLGLFFLLRSYIPAIAWDRFWPILLVAAGVALLVAAMGRRRD
ncbi:MAG TPA: PspC domain-containing protein, partial [Candidatus Limnocylindria bacterium]|nr:PspC domain-containing protein [Candidatus Limnocylindria bacterium]